MQLYLGSNTGLSDNGDFRRVLLVNNLEYADSTDYNYLFKQYYKMTDMHGETIGDVVKSLWETNKESDIYSSPQFLIIKISKTINYFVNMLTGADRASYNIMWLALLYIFMFSIAAWGIFNFFSEAKPAVRIGVFAGFLLMFCDNGYIYYFNSFYGEPLQYTALMMLISVGLLIYRRPSVPKIICFFVALYFFAGSKLANIPYSVIVCILSVTFLALRRDFIFRAGCVISLIAAVAAIVNLSASIPQWMHNDTTYQAVFFGILKESDSPEKDLKFLGVDEKYAVLANTNAYMAADEYPIDITTEEFEHDFYDKVSKADIAAFHVLHPVRFVRQLCFAIENSAYIRPPSVGTSSVVPMEYEAKFGLWSRLRTALKFLYNPIVVFAAFLFITAYIVIIDIFYIKRRHSEPNKNIYMMASMNVLVIGCWINLVLPIIGNGEADIAKHMFLFVTCIDIFFEVIIINILSVKRRNRLLSCTALLILTLACNYHIPKQTVVFGTYRGEPIVWEVYEVLNDGTQILITKDNIVEMPFSDKVNLWEYSKVREWLNGEFLDEFTDEEKASIVKSTNSMIVPTAFRSLAIAGNHTHYWNYTRKSANDLSKTAYHYYLEDEVYIPTLEMLEDINDSKSYWVLCPYGNADNMQRYVSGDGFVLHTRVENERGVRAVIRCKTDTANER